MNTHTISFNPDGTALCLWTDAISLHELGRLEIIRATNIEFNNAAQKWEVRDRKGRVRFIAKSRSTCLEWEQENLQDQEFGTPVLQPFAHPDATPYLSVSQPPRLQAEAEESSS